MSAMNAIRRVAMTQLRTGRGLANVPCRRYLRHHCHSNWYPVTWGGANPRCNGVLSTNVAGPGWIRCNGTSSSNTNGVGVGVDVDFYEQSIERRERTTNSTPKGQPARAASRGSRRGAAAHSRGNDFLRHSGTHGRAMRRRSDGTRRSGGMDGHRTRNNNDDDNGYGHDHGSTSSGGHGMNHRRSRYQPDDRSRANQGGWTRGGKGTYNRHRVSLDYAGFDSIHDHSHRNDHSHGNSDQHNAGFRPNDKRNAWQQGSAQYLHGGYSKDGRWDQHGHPDRRTELWFPPKTLTILVTCLPGLEDCLSMELDSLDIEHTVTESGITLQDVTIDELFQCHLFLGTASHILLQCGGPFYARQLAELERKVSKMPWRKILKRNVKLETRVSCSKSKMYHTTAVRDRILRSVYQELGYGVSSADDHPNTADGDEGKTALQRVLLEVQDHPAVKLDVRIKRDMVTIYIDGSLTPLHERGYKKDVAKAPLREDMAYAMLMEGGWMPRYFDPALIAGTWMRSDNDSLERRKRETSKKSGTHVYDSLVDPMCGCGTIAIEAAAMAGGLPPGRLRPPPFEGTRLRNPSRWNKLVKAESVDHRTLKKVLRRRHIRASDRDAGAIVATKSNAARAGVADIIDIDRHSISSQPWFEDPEQAPGSLLVASNPPFGKRVSPTGDGGASSNNKKHINSKGRSPRSTRKDHPLLPLYQKLGHCVKKLQEAGKDVGAVLVGNDASLLRRTGMSDLKLKIKYNHGGLAASVMSLSPPSSEETGDEGSEDS